MIEYFENVLSNDELTDLKKDINLIKPLCNRYDYNGSEDNKKSGKSWFADKFICSTITPTINKLCEKYNHSENYSTIYCEYENNDFYKNHKDDSLKTLVYFYKDIDDNFDGGDLIVNDKKFNHVDNSCVIFDGKYSHEVSPVKTKCGSRKTITIFYY